MERVIIEDDGRYLRGAERNRLLEYTLLATYEALDRIQEVQKEVRLWPDDQRLLKNTVTDLIKLTQRLKSLKRVYT